jgi:hypothetical protein
MNHHEGARVVPGRCAGEAIASHEGPTPDQVASAKQRAHADCAGGEDLRRSCRGEPLSVCLGGAGG